MPENGPHDEANERLAEQIEAESSALPGGKTQEQLAEEVREAHRRMQEERITIPPDPPTPHTVWEPGKIIEVPPERNILDMRPRAIQGKAAKIIYEAGQTGEPIFVFRAKDIFSVMVVSDYLGYIERYGSGADDMAISVTEQLEAMKAWQRANPDKVRYPD